jgi:hypothetical protein
VQDEAEGVSAAPERHARARSGAVVRNLADAQGVPLLELEPGALVAVHKERAGWLWVEVPGGFPVWVYGRFLEPTDTPDVYEVTGDGVNLRPLAGRDVSNYPLGGRLRQGDRVLAIERQDPSAPLEDDWVRVWSPPGIRGWLPADEAEPLEPGADGGALWRAAIDSLAQQLPAAALGSGAREAAASTNGAAEHAGGPVRDAEVEAMKLLEEARELLAEQRRSGAGDFADVRQSYSRVLELAPGGVAGALARQGLDTVDALEAAASIRSELELERERRKEDLLTKQEEIWEKSRQKDPLYGHFDGRGVLERRGRAGEEPRYWLRWRGEDVYELTCATGRYDLDLFAGYEIGVHGSAATREESAPVLDVARIEVLSRR